MIKVVVRYLLPGSITLTTFGAFWHNSMDPLVFHYSYGYMIFLGMMMTWTILSWKIALTEESYLRFYNRLGSIPIVSLLTIGGSMGGILCFFWKETSETLSFLGVNRILLGFVIVSSGMLTMSVLASTNCRAMITNYAVLTGTCLAVLLLAEGGLRIAAYYQIHLFDRLKHPSKKPKPGEEVTLGRLIRLSNNPRILYELIPDISVIFGSQPVSINSDGFRGNSIPLERDKGSIRIIGLGDSVMFGWGVKDHETYLAQLAYLLHTTYPQYSWDIVNTAVPGYNTVMEVETLKEKGLQYTPDLIIIEYVSNDLNLPNFIQGWESPFLLKKLFFKQFIAQLTHSAEIPDRLIELPLDMIEEYVEETPQRVPEQYRDMVGKDAYYHAMQELHRLSQEYDFEVVVMSIGFPPFVADICRQFQFEMIAIYPAWKEYVATHEIVDEQAAWKLRPDDPHPSILGHRVIAEAIFEQFRTRGLIQKLKKNTNSFEK